MIARTVCACVALMLSLIPAAAHGQGVTDEWFVGAHAGVMPVRVEYHEPQRPEFDANPRTAGFVGGVLAGYDRESGRLLIGIDVDFSSGTADLDPEDAGGHRNTAIDLGWQTRLRGKAGATWRTTRLFAAAGLVTVRAEIDNVDPGFGDGSARYFGWTAGAGLDYAIAARFRVRAEYMYDNYRPEFHSLAAPPGEFFPGYEVETSFTAHTFRTAVVYRF
jgi:outer membrane immunogenic protein